jgi:ribosomal protein S18 acetylase RimI-like enzyme
MSKFAEYEPGAERKSRFTIYIRLVIQPPRESDLPALAAIAAEREGEPAADWLAAFERIYAESRAGRALILAAAVDNLMAGYGKAGYFVPPAGSPANVAPEGWYLTGVVVRPALRRRGVGLQLTQARLSWIAGRSDRAYYFANERNQVSIDLHRALGFAELTRDFSHPQVQFEGGRGILFVRELRARRSGRLSRADGEVL